MCRKYLRYKLDLICPFWENTHERVARLRRQVTQKDKEWMRLCGSGHCLTCAIKAMQSDESAKIGMNQYEQNKACGCPRCLLTLLNKNAVEDPAFFRHLEKLGEPVLTRSVRDDQGRLRLLLP